MFIQNALWGEVAQEMNSTVEEVRSKWKKLRGAFMGTRNRMRARGRRVDDLKFPDYKSWRRFRRLSFLCKQYRPNWGNVNIQPNEEKTLTDDETHTGEGESSQSSSSGQEFELCAEVRKMTPGAEFSPCSTMPLFTALGVQREQSTSCANRVDTPPEAKNNLRDAQTGTRDEVLQSSELSKVNGAATDVRDVETEASGSLYLTEQRATLNLESRWSEQSTSCSFQSHVGNCSITHIGTNCGNE
jgi:hypothetical protein